MATANPKISVITTGLNGLIGSKLETDFNQKYAFENLDILHPTTPVDITNYDQIMARFALVPEAKEVVHFAAFTDVNAAWNQRGDKTGIVYKVNVGGTENLIKACQTTGKHLIHISTAYVFNGEKTDSYLETDPMSPIEWYGQTKSLAEEAVQNSDIDWTILRIDMPFRSDAFAKIDFAHRVIKGMTEGKLYPQFNNHYVGPTFIDDFVKIIDFILRTKTTGLFHASSGEKWTDYDFAKTVSQSLNLGFDVKVGDLNAYLATLERPYQKNTSLNCQKLHQILDFKPSSVAEAIGKIKPPFFLNQ